MYPLLIVIIVPVSTAIKDHYSFVPPSVLPKDCITASFASYDMSLSLDSTIKLASGNLIPRLGFGVYQARSKECEDAVKKAIEVGYRHGMLLCPFHPILSSNLFPILFQWTLRKVIITKKVRPSFCELVRAPYLQSDLDVGRAIRDSGVPRSSVFLTSKYMPSHTVYSPTEVLDVVRKSLKKVDRCGEDKPYIDLMLIHAPWGGEEGRKNNWEALALAQKEGWVKDIGVSNLCVLTGVAVQ